MRRIEVICHVETEIIDAQPGIEVQFLVQQFHSFLQVSGKVRDMSIRAGRDRLQSPRPRFGSNQH
jgi:hypothetical protein